MKDTQEIQAFFMTRDADESGVSGTGKVLEGVVFEDGTTIIRWCVKSMPNSVAIYKSFADFERIHITSHPTNGTKISWRRFIDPELDDEVITFERNISSDGNGRSKQLSIPMKLGDKVEVGFRYIVTLRRQVSDKISKGKRYKDLPYIKVIK